VVGRALAALAGGLLLAACERGRAASAVASCEAALTSGAAEEVIGRCTSAYEEAPSPRLAAAIAKAWERGDHPSPDQVLAWVERVGRDPQYARAWLRAARVYRDRGDLPGARAIYEWVADVTEQDDPATAGRALAGLRAIDNDEGHHGRSLALAVRMLALAEQADDDDLRARSWRALFGSALQLGDTRLAELAIARARTVISADQPAWPVLQFAEASLDHERGRWSLAADGYERVAVTAAATDDFALERAARLNRVEVLVSAGRIDDARAELDRVPVGKSKAALISDAYYHALVSLEDAREDVEALLDGAYAHEPPADWRWQLALLRGRAAERRGDVDAAERAYVDAVEAVDEVRADALYEELQPSVHALRRAPAERLFTLRARRGAVDDALPIALAALGNDTLIQARAGEVLPLDDLDEAVEATGARIEELLAVVPRLRRLAEAPEIDLSASSSTIEWVYFDAIGTRWMAVMSDGRRRIFELGTTASLDALTSTLASNLDSRDAATALGRAMIPRDAWPPMGARVAILADRATTGVPFALLRHEERRLIDDAVLVVRPGPGSSSPPPTDDSAVIVGDAYGDLSAARAEALSVATLLETDAAIGDEAVRARLDDARATGVLHIAGHSSRTANGATLELADGPVSTSDIIELGIAPRLVVLSTCASGAASGQRTDDALASAFLAAGAGGVIATHWSVDDAAAWWFADSFYGAGGRDDPAAALAIVQRRAAAEGRPARDWAGYVYISGLREEP
jgi:tetratricopeptide (TPR) repeat protein